MLLGQNGYHDVPAGKLAAVTTSLQMFARPALRPERGAPGQLRRVAQPEVAWYRDLYYRIGAEWLWFSRLRMAPDALAGLIGHPAVEVYTLTTIGERDEGLIELDFREPQVCELRMFGVTAPLIGTGAGRWLMNRAIEAAWAKPIGRFWLHTCTFDHPAALAFYLRSGFVPFRRQIEIADDPRLDGTFSRELAAHVPII